MKNTKNTFLAWMFIVAITGSAVSYAVGSEDIADIACEAAKSAFKENAEALLGAGSCLQAAVNVYTVSKDLKSYLCPSEEEQVEAIEIDKELKVLELKRLLKGCLIQHRKSIASGPLEIPVECEEMAIVLGLLGEHTEALRMAEIFKRFNT